VAMANADTPDPIMVELRSSASGEDRRGRR
jgi:hypothetical protein